MKISIPKYFIIITWILFSLLNSCKKEPAKVNPFVPTVITTDTITNITATSATSGGEITSDARTPITARGVCWSTSQNPTIADNHTSDGTGTGSFTSIITGLATGTTYYIKAYATNSIGRTGYGNGISFEFNDYLPLKVGAKYKYNYSQFYHYIDGGYVKYGECTWKFISMSADTSVVYQVEQSLTGYTVSQSQIWNGSIYIVRNDTTHFENQISTLSFEVLNDGEVVFTWPQTKVTLERFIQSGRNDTCFRSNPYEQVCLRKNVGIISLFSLPMHGNHQAGSDYTLIEGPTY